MLKAFSLLLLQLSKFLHFLLCHARTFIHSLFDISLAGHKKITLEKGQSMGHCWCTVHKTVFISFLQDMLMVRHLNELVPAAWKSTIPHRWSSKSCWSKHLHWRLNTPSQWWLITTDCKFIAIENLFMPNKICSQLVVVSFFFFLEPFCKLLCALYQSKCSRLVCNLHFASRICLNLGVWMYSQTI